jgi:hypothetical protein
MQSGSSPAPAEQVQVEGAAVRQSSDEVPGLVAVEGRLKRISRTHLQDLTPPDTFLFLNSKITAIKPFELLWNVRGSQLIGYGPVNFIRSIQSEYFSFPRSLATDVFMAVKQKLIDDLSLGDHPNPIGENLFREWYDAQVPSVPSSPLFQERRSPNSDSDLTQLLSSVSNSFQNSNSGLNSNSFSAVQNSNSLNPVQNSNSLNPVQNSNSLNPFQNSNSGLNSNSFMVQMNLENLYTPVTNRVDQAPGNVSNVLGSYSAADVRVAISSACENFRMAHNGFQWPMTTIDGKFLLESTPTRFNSKFNAEVANLSEVQKIEASKWVQTQIMAQAQSVPNSVDEDTLRIWSNMPRNFPMLQTSHESSFNLQLPTTNPFVFSSPLGLATPSSTKNSKFVIGGPRVPLQNSMFSNIADNGSLSRAFQQYPGLAANVFSQQLGQMTASAVPLPYQVGQMVASAAPMPTHGLTAASAAQMPQNVSQIAASAAPMLSPFTGPMAASAVQMPVNFGPMAASAVQMPNNYGQKAASAAQSPQFNATPLYSPMPMGPNQSHLANLLSNPLVNQLFHSSQSQVVSKKPLLPWAAAAKIAAPFLQDPSMPKGYKRLSVSKIILAAKAQRMLTPTHVDVSKAVRYPTMRTFSKEDFVDTRAKYFEAVKSSTMNGMFSSFKSCLTVTAQNVAKRLFELNDERFIELDDELFLKWCALYFGPNNKKEALKLLNSVKIFHRDSVHSQKEFIAKFDQVCYDHEMAVNDIIDSQEKWPFDEEDIECAGLTLKEISREWKDIFPKQEGSRIFSVQMKKCRTYIEQNLEVPFNEQVVKLRAYFAKKDLEVAEADEKYSTEPSRFESRSKFKRRDYQESVEVSALDSKREVGSKRDRNSNQSSKAKFARKVVAGKDRGIACGSLNNHNGLGCAKNSCPVFGTEYDKSREKGHVWKSSDMEESVHMPDDLWKKRLQDNPKIIENWKMARHDKRDQKHKVRVSALNALDDDDEEFKQEDANDVDEDNETTSESEDSDDVVNSRQYSFQACALDSDLFCELGHEKQFFGATRFCKNDEFVYKTLMDPGATINIICPEVANRAALQRKQLAVNIFQGKRKQGSVEEMVQCRFELQSVDGAYATHVEWFAVCDLGYDVLLGRRFCRTKGFTSFDEKLKKFEELPVRENAINVSALKLAEQRMLLRFDRVAAPLGKARYKRKAKAVSVTANAESSCIGEFLLSASDTKAARASGCAHTNALSSLLILEKKEVDGKNFVLLSFTVDTADGERSSKLQNWFQVVDGHSLSLSTADVSRIMASEKVFLLKRVWSNSTEAAKEAPKARSTELSDVDVEAKKKEISRLSAKVKSDNEIRFASYHPVKGYRLHRNAEKPPLSPHWKKDHLNYEAQRDYRGERAEIRKAAEAAQLEFLCKQKHRAFRVMLSALATADVKSRGISPDVDCWLDQLQCNRVVDMPSEAVEEQSWTSEFKPGDYVEIANAVIQPRFNGQRVRLFGKTSDDKFWIVRLLGKNGGKRRCNESMFKRISEIEQKRSVPSGASAGFDDVGIDENGVPNVELKTVVHRQFGEEHSAELTARIKALKERFPKVFTTDVTEPCLFEPMKIRLLPNAVLPSKARYYRNTPKMREEVRRQIQEQLEWGAIRKCVTPCVSDVLLVKRPHMPGKFRFVVSYVKLNDATVKEQLIMPDPKSQYERLAGKKIFGALDFSSYYRQIRLHEDSQYLTGFASDEGTYVYTRVPMGVTGACQYAQKVLQDALAADPVLGSLGIKNYFDDLPFGADTEDEFMTILEALLNFCAKWQLKVNPDKTVLGVTSITHVGFVVNKDGVAIDPERTRDIVELTAPKSLKKVQSVLGIFNYVRNFIPGFSQKAKFLTDKLNAVAKVPKAASGEAKPSKKRKVDEQNAEVVAALSVDVKRAKKEKVLPKFEWTEEDGLQFEALKQCVLKAPLLAQLDYGLPIYIRCDASRFGAGAVLFQYDDRGYEHPVCYASRKFLAAEKNWSTFSQEASTVVWALERFAEYTQGYHTIVECDHRNISFVKKSAMPQLARWRLRLQDMDFTVRYLAGPRNLTADGLSRQHVDDVEVTMSDVIPECALPKDELVLSADIAELYSVELAALYPEDVAKGQVQFGAKVVRESSSTVEVTQTDLRESALDGAAVEADDSSSDSDSTDSDEDSVIDLTEIGPDGMLLNRFGVNGELLNADGVAIVREEMQPSHLAVPLLDADSEIKAVHNDLSGHAGTYVTLQRALRNGRVWASRSQMLLDIDDFIMKCDCCQKMRKRSSKSLIDRHVLSGSPFSELSIDLLKLPEPDAFGMAYVVVIVDNFSHWTSLVAVRNKSAFEAARALAKVIGDFGAPMRLRSDGGSEFVNGVIAGLLRMMGVTHHVVAPYTPSANGIVERANRAILERLRQMIFSKRLVVHPQHVWSDLLPLVQRSINASVHSATGTSPAKILFGDNLDLDRCLLTHMPAARVLDCNRYVDALTYNQRIILEEADKHQSDLCQRIIAKSHRGQGRKNKDGVFIPAVHKEIELGDWVLVAPGPSYPLHKLSPRWLGPFRVIECSTESELVRVEDTLKRKVRSFLRRQLELFDARAIADAEGLKVVAETDGFEFPVEAIIGHALVEQGGVGVSPVQLPVSFKRGSRTKKSFQFLVKWTGYEEPTWVEYKVASRLVQFPGYVAMLPNLRMD